MKKKIEKILGNLCVILGMTGIATIIGYLFLRWDLQEPSVVIVYILFVLLTASITDGYVYGIGAAAASFLLFNWFFTEPYFSLKINDPTLILTAIIMFIIGSITSALTSKVKQNAAEAKKKEEESNALYQMTNHLTDAETNEKIASILVDTVSIYLDCNAAYAGFDESGTAFNYFIQRKDDGTQMHRELDNFDEFQTRMKNLHSPYDEGKEFFDFPIYGRARLLAVLRIPKECGEKLTEDELRVIHSAMESTSLALDRIQSFQEQAKSHEEAVQERYRGDLLRAISHDLRTPLSVIMGNSEILMGMTKEDDPRFDLAKDIYEDADWLHGLVENILSMTRFQNQQFTLKKEAEPVEEVVGAALVVIEKRTANHEIDVDIPDNLLMVPMDARLITQVLVNLLDNAVKHTDPGQEIKISVTVDTQENVAKFSVSDRGTGIPRDALKKIFDMFYTTSKHETAARKGIGIGLPICKSIIKAHGGRIWAENRVGKGSRFIFTLPLEDEK